MWKSKRQLELDKQALALTPCAEWDFSGRWSVMQNIESQEVAWSAVLEQSGVQVVGEMQQKLAALHPLKIQGLIENGYLIATIWRPHKDGMGSGVLRIKLDSSKAVLEGQATWNGDDGSHGLMGLRWHKQPADK